MNDKLARLRRKIELGLRGRHRAYCLIASPRSGSNSLMNRLAATLELPVVQMKVEPGFGHLIADFRIAPNVGPFVWYQHLFPTPQNTNVVNHFARANPIVTYREVFGWVMSMVNFIKKYGRSPWGLELDARLLQSPNFDNLDLSSVARYVVDFELPLYLRFLSGWMHAELARPVLWVNYRDLTQNPYALQSRLRDQAGFPIGGPPWTTQSEGRESLQRSPAEIQAILGPRNCQRIIDLVEGTNLKWLLEE